MFVSIRDLDEYMQPVEKRNSLYLEGNRDDILKLLVEKGVSYPSEISRQCNMYIEAVNQIIQNLVKVGFVKKITPDPNNPQPVFLGRMAEFWASGLVGYETFSRRSWWMPTEAGIEYIRARYKGEGLSIKGSLIKMYGFEVKE